MRLTDLADVLRAAGLTVYEVDDWKTRGRSRDAGQYRDGRPSHIIEHHTADGGPNSERPVRSPSGQIIPWTVWYMTYSSSARPVANICTLRNGDVWVMAAGPTNTEGKGSADWCDFVAVNDMNAHAISNEISNRGTGEPYPPAQQDSVLIATRAMSAHYKIAPEFCRAHFEWTGRKIDPTGPARWAPSGGKWNMDHFRTDIATIPEEPPEDFDMITPGVYRPPANLGGNPPWLYKNEHGVWSYADSDTATEADDRGAMNDDQYPWAYLAAFGVTL